MFSPPSGRSAGGSAVPSSRGAPAPTNGVENVVAAIDRIRKDREARRQSQQFRRAQSADDETGNGGGSSGGGGGGGGGGVSGGGGSGDGRSGGGVGSGANRPPPPISRADRDTLEYIRMLRAFRDENGRTAQPYAPSGEKSIAVVVRKRPINSKETSVGDYDAVTCLNPRAIVHAPKKKVDGITRYLEHTAFQFDYAFDEATDTQTVYAHTVKPLVDFAFRGGRATCFAYGQTGSGKTHTMSGIQELVATDIFARLNAPDVRGRLELAASFFEIYGGRAFDVLHGRNTVLIREDERHRVVASGLQEVVCKDTAALLAVIAQGNAGRTTHSTEVNAHSSRSHLICELTIRTVGGAGGAAKKGGDHRSLQGLHGSLSLIDLAGSERAADSRNHAQARRIESAEINTSLLALKECIRALAVRANAADGEHVHVPFRASKLTLALRDSFESPRSRVVMIATVSPCASSWDHTGNTLRYADRVKEQPNMEFDEHGRVIGGAPKNAQVREGAAKSYSYSASDGVSNGNEVGDGGAIFPPRVSPVTVEGESPRGDSGVITGAKAPPMPIFKRERIAADRAAADVRQRGPTSTSVAATASRQHHENGSDDDEEDMGAAVDATPTAVSAPSRGSLMSPPLRVPVSQVGGSGRGVGARRVGGDESGSSSLNDSLDEASGGGGRAAPLPPTGLARLMQRNAVGKPPVAPGGASSTATASASASSASISEPTTSSSARVRARLANKGRSGPTAAAAAAAPPRGGGGDFEEDSEGGASAGGSSLERGGGGGGRRSSTRREKISSPQQADIRALHESMRRDAGARGTGGGGGAASRDDDDDDEDLLALHEAVGMIVDLEQDLMDAHLKAIQENAVLLTEEGKLLAALQSVGGPGADDGDYDMGAYAGQLQALLLKKQRTTNALISQIEKFKDSLRHEELVSTMRAGGGRD